MSAIRKKIKEKGISELSLHAARNYNARFKSFMLLIEGTVSGILPLFAV